MYTGGLYLEQKMRRSCLLILPKSYYIYNKWVTWRAGAKQARCGYPLSSMKIHQANAAYGEKDKYALARDIGTKSREITHWSEASPATGVAWLCHLTQFA